MQIEMGKITHLEGPNLKPDGKKDDEQKGSTWDIVDGAIKEHEMIIFAKSTCPHCLELEQFLQRKGAEFSLVNLDLVPNGKEIQEELKKHTGQDTVPNTFVKGVHIGTKEQSRDAWEDGKIQKLLKGEE